MGKTLTVEVTCSTGGGISNNPSVYAQGFVSPSGTRKLLLVNKAHTPYQGLEVPGIDGSTALVVDLETGFGPPRTEQISGNSINLAAFAVAVVMLK